MPSSTSYLCRSLIRQKAQRINRRDKSLLSAKVASAKQQLLAAGRRTGTAGELVRSESLRIKSLLSTISQVDDRLHPHVLKNKELYKLRRATDMREKKAHSSLKRVMKELCTKSNWSNEPTGLYAPLALTRAVCAQARLGPHLARVGEVFGVQIKWSMSGRTQAKVEDAAAPSAVGRQPRTVERAGPGCDEAEGDEETKQKCAKQSLRPMHVLADPIRHQRLNDTRRYNTHASLDTCNHLNPQLGVARLNSGLFEGRSHMPLAGHQTAIN
ncbi:hypothetical protein DFH06DRAFT_1297704 [Mycena polygramma]|nr:hypothetical protein DFH06DRAFT_1297704 [Mycena polygramma]